MGAIDGLGCYTGYTLRALPKETRQKMTAEPDKKPDTPEATPDAKAQGAKTQAERRPKKARKRAALGFLALLAVLFLVVGGFIGLLILRQEPLEAPEWVHSRIQNQLNGAIAPYSAKIGKTELSLEEGWVPRLQLQDTALRDQAGARLVALDHIEVRVSIRQLLRGKLRPISLALSGTRLKVRRDGAGAFWLSFGEELTTDGPGKSFAQLVGEVDTLLLRPEFSDFASIEASDMTVRYEDERARRAWTVDGGRVELKKSVQDLTLRADFALLTGGAEAAGVEMSFASPIGSYEATIGMNLTDFPARDLASQSAALSWLEALRAPISGALRVTMDDEGELGPLSATLNIENGVLQPTDQTQPIPFETARTYLTYDPADQIVRFDEITLQSEWVTLRADGKLGLVMSDSGWPSSFVGQLKFADIKAKAGDLLQEEVRFDGGYADLQLRLDPFRVNLGQLSLTDGATRFHVEGDFDALKEGWSYQLQAGVNAVSLEKVLNFWPPKLAERTRGWVARNVLAGRVEEAQFGLRANPDEKPVTFLSFGYSDVELRFIKTMPTITGLTGQASLFRKRFAARATKGRISAPQGGQLDVAGTEFIIPETKPGGAQANVNLQARGQITALLSVLDQEPLRLLSKAKQSVTMADGRAQVQGAISWPMQPKLPPELVRYNVAGKLSDVRSTTLVPGRVLASKSLDVKATNAALVVSGDGRLDTVPVEGRFTVPLGAQSTGTNTLKGSVELSAEAVKVFNIGLPSGAVSGRGRAQFDIVFTKGKQPGFSLSSNLAGVGLRIPQVGWRKSAGSPGKLSVTGAFGAPMRVDQILLNTAGLDARGDVVLDAAGGFKEARFERVKIGNWLNVPLKFVSRGKGRAPALNIMGGRLDLSQTSFTESGSSGSDGGPISARLDEMKISDGIALTKFRGEFSTARGFEGNFSGLVNGQAPVEGRIVPQAGRSAFQINSDNGGRVLAAAGLLKNATGGAMKLTLAPAKATGVYNGALDISKVRLRDAPAMAALLNAASIVGLLDQLGGQGILFNAVEARFQMTPTQVIVSRSSAVGASMGISMDGYYTLASGVMDMQGVVSPIFLLNGIGAIFTRKGEGLVGFNYRLKGTGTEPKVQVNPLSIFTPGMFREIFRRPVPKVSQ